MTHSKNQLKNWAASRSDSPSRFADIDPEVNYLTLPAHIVYFFIVSQVQACGEQMSQLVIHFNK